MRTPSLILNKASFLATPRSICCRCLNNRLISTSPSLSYDEYDEKKWFEPGESPLQRTINVFKHDYNRMKRRFLNARNNPYQRDNVFTRTARAIARDPMDHEFIPYDSTFLIIGGGLVGSSIAWWIKQRTRDEDLKVTVIEADSTFSKCATVLSAGGIRQQFSLQENVEMSLFTAEFLRNAGEHLRILDSEQPDIHFTPMGYLFLATNDDSAKKMEKNWKMQTNCGAKVKLMNREELQLRFPFMKFDDIVLGSFGLENEGVIDGWQLLSAIREKNLTLGVKYVKAKVTNFRYRYINDFDPSGYYPDEEHWRFKEIESLIVQPQMTDASPRPMKAMTYINAAGPWAGEVARMVGIGLGTDMMSVPIPIVPRKRYVYVVHCPNGPGLDMPFLVDPSGVWCRREGVGNIYICGKSPTEEEDNKIDHSNLDVDYNFFDEQIWPVLAARVPAFEHLKVKNAWAGWYDYNLFDQNAIIGSHFHHQNFFTCAGFSGHGLQHAITAARGVMEKWLDGAYIRINYKPFGMERIFRNRPLLEDAII